MVFKALVEKLKQGLSKTRRIFTGVAQLFRLKGKVDRDFLNELEKRLSEADLGTTATSQVVERVRQAFLDKEITGDVEMFVKQPSEKSSPARHLLVETRFLRKPGQSDTDPATGNYRQGQFESWTRFEIFDPGYR